MDMPAAGIRQNIDHLSKVEMTRLTHPSPNFGERKLGMTPDIVVLHYTAMQSAEAACRTLSNPDAQVSAHYLISEAGKVFSLVDETKRAWHAGVGSWAGVEDVNSRSIGIELANDGFSPFSSKLMDALEELLSAVLARWSIPVCRVIAHSDLAPGRKIDPGLRFDWQRLVRHNLAVWPEARLADPAVFHEAACAFGYSGAVCDETRLAAFRRRFRFGKDGPLDHVDAGMAADLADRFSVDWAPIQA